MTSISTCCDCSDAPTRHFIHETGVGCAECRLHYYAHRKVKPDWAEGGFRFILGEHTFVKLTER